MNIWQQNNFKKLIIIAIIQAITFMPVFAIDLDYTVDDAIRKNYKVEQGPNTNPVVTPVPKTVTPTSVQQPQKSSSESMPKLPALPKTTTQAKPTQAKPVQAVNKTTVKQPIQNISRSAIARTTQQTYTCIPLRKGTEIEISNINAISDKQKAGTNIVFVSDKPVRTPYYTIPQGTKFVGKIVESHNPQIIGNGGLVSIEVVTIILANQYQHIDTRITKINDKRIFFEDIKGKHSYWKNTVNKGKWGRNTYKKMKKLSSNLAKDKTTVILSPFTFIYGVTLGCISTVSSPVVSIFCKGGSVNLSVGTKFVIKFEKDAKIRVSN